MSTPMNPLSAYRSYTYHHILIACDSTATANAISNSVKISDFIRPKSGESKYTPMAAPGGGKYIVVINGLVDAEFIISEVEWMSTTAANDKPVNSGDSRFVTLANEGKMVVSEPNGLQFLNVMANASRVLGRDPSSTVWMLKTIFIGHGDSHSPSLADPITNLNPLQLVIFDITANFDVTGGKYLIEFAAMSNGAAKMPQYANATSSLSINIEKDHTLSGALTELNAAIAYAYEKTLADATAVLAKQNATPIRVTYNITYDDRYADPQYTLDLLLPGSNENLDFSKGVTVENAIRTIMSKCGKVVADAQDADSPMTWKVLTNVDVRTDDILVTFHITSFKKVTSDLISDVLSNKITDDNIKGNLISFEYIYSGKNTDILDFNMKMDMGLAFFQTLLIHPPVADQNETTATSETESDMTVQTHVKPDLLEHRKVPVYFGSSVTPMKSTHTPRPRSSAQYQHMLSQHAALEQIDGTVKIIGNPYLMSATNRDSKLLETYHPDSNAMMAQWGYFPALAEIKVYMPSSPGNDDYREQTWYQGYYYIYGITNSFSNGEFTQTLDVVSLPSHTTT